jgi:hypothetical protein
MTGCLSWVGYFYWRVLKDLIWSILVQRACLKAARKVRDNPDIMIMS